VADSSPLISLSYCSEPTFFVFFRRSRRYALELATLRVGGVVTLWGWEVVLGVGRGGHALVGIQKAGSRGVRVYCTNTMIPLLVNY
jgi:hypothetical protein